MQKLKAIRSKTLAMVEFIVLKFLNPYQIHRNYKLNSGLTKNGSKVI